MQETRETGSISESGRSPGGGNGNLQQHSCWEIPWTEEPGRLQAIGSQRIGPDLATELTHKTTHEVYIRTVPSKWKCIVAE